MDSSEVDIKQLLEVMVNLGASDLHLTVGSPPMYRIDGDLRPVDCAPLTPKQVEDTMRSLIPPAKRPALDENGTVDFSFAIHGVGRYRVNVFHQRGSISLVVRLVNNRVLTFAELGLPGSLARIADQRRGLVLVTGPSGSGKSSTVAAMIRHINDTRRAHILTIEDPIEFLHAHNRSIVNQIELGVDTRDFPTALRHMMRQDPDVILLADLKDREAVAAALHAAETGHLVFATLHTADARKSVRRLLDCFEDEDEKGLLAELAAHLRAIVSQRLVRRADGKGRVPIVEILVNTPTVERLIADGAIEDFGLAIRTHEAGMIGFDQSLAEAVRAGRIAMDEALQLVEDRAAFMQDLERPGEGSGATAIAG
jgi:twitching motility protein PilT